MKGDGYSNDDERESAAFQRVNFIDGVEVTDEECASYDDLASYSSKSLKSLAFGG